MKGRLISIACALLLSSLVIPAANAGQQRTPAFRTSAPSLMRSGAFTGFGHGERGLCGTKAPVRPCTTYRAGYCPAPRR